MSAPIVVSPIVVDVDQFSRHQGGACMYASDSASRADFMFACRPGYLSPCQDLIADSQFRVFVIARMLFVQLRHLNVTTCFWQRDCCRFTWFLALRLQTCVVRILF